MILVDTDVIIWALRGSLPAQEWLQQARRQSPLAISAITTFEVFGGMRDEERMRVSSALASFRVEPVTESIGRRAGEFRREWHRSHRAIESTDYLIAATADTLGAELSTLNVKHYPMFKGLKRPFTP